MDKQEAGRKLRADLTEEQKAEALRIGRIAFKSIRRVDHRIEPFIPSRTQH
jgi:hypothetical protein